MMKTIYRLEKEKSQLIENFSYQKVEYIQSSGTQYIDTLFADPNGIRVCYKAMWLDDDGGPIIGSINEKEPYGRNMAYWTRNQFEFGYGETYEKFGNGGPNIEYDVDFKTTKTEAYFRVKGGIYKEWETLIKTSGEKISENNNLIFTNQWAKLQSFYFKAKLYYVRIFDSKDILVRDFFPAITYSDKKVGLYDLVTKKFYVNNGKENLIAGNK